MAFVLGPQAENAIRQSLILSDNSLLIFVQRPISAIVLGLAVIVVVLAILSRRRGNRLPTKDSVLPDLELDDVTAPEPNQSDPALIKSVETREVNQ
jgi:hypothetical protein